MQTVTLVGSGLGLEVIEPMPTVGPTRPGLDGCGGGNCGLGVISQQNWWSTARSGGQNGLGIPISHTYGLGQGAGDRVKEFFSSTNTYVAFGVGAAVGAVVMAVLKR